MSLLNEETNPETKESTLEETEDLRPEWLPEKYKTIEDLAKGHKELEAKFGQKRELIEQEIRDSMFKDRPSSKGEYELPDGLDESESVGNELLEWWAEHSFENGYSQDQFAKGIEMYASAMKAAQPEPIDFEAEAQKLGDDAITRITAADAFAKKFFPDETLPAIARMCETHEGILALEAVMDAIKQGGALDSEPTSQVTAESLQTMVRDERYWNPAKRDKAFVKMVDDGFANLYRG